MLHTPRPIIMERSVRRAIPLFFAAIAVMGQGGYDPHVIRMPPPGPTAVPQNGPQIVEEAGDAVAWRGRGGTFEVRASINGETVPMTFDTGASAVSLRAEDAERIGIDVSALHYSVTTHTANGTTSVAPVIIRSLQIGSIVETNVAAVVARPHALSTNLLGQTFLSRLSNYTVEQDRVVFHRR
jgi:clan AA aspartic protease (TIGR02281 family)